jgi:cytochrome c553
MVTASAGVALWRADAVAQSAIVDELRPLYASSDDIRDGKELADSTCAKCHGADGVSTTSGVPNLAGQRPSYVYHKLNAYQRGDPTGGEAHNMKLMKFFSDEALANLAPITRVSIPPRSPMRRRRNMSIRSRPARRPRSLARNATVRAVSVTRRACQV